MKKSSATYIIWGWFVMLGSISFVVWYWLNDGDELALAVIGGIITFISSYLLVRINSKEIK